MRRAALLPRLFLPLLFLPPLLLSPAFAAERAPPGASSCLSCHGSAQAGFPVLDGRPAERIAAELARFRAGTRRASVMNRIARGFSEEESRAIAAYFAARGSAR